MRSASKLQSVPGPSFLRLEQRRRAHFIRDELGDVITRGDTVRGDEGRKERFSGTRRAPKDLDAFAQRRCVALIDDKGGTAPLHFAQVDDAIRPIDE